MQQEKKDKRRHTANQRMDTVKKQIQNTKNQETEEADRNMRRHTGRRTEDDTERDIAHE